MGNYDDLKLFSVGMVDDIWANGVDGAFMDFTGNYLLLYVFLSNISDEEMTGYGADSRFNIRFVEKDDICFFITKFELCSTIDCPFSPCIYDNPPSYDNPPEEGQGLALHIFLIESTKGELKCIRTIGLGHEFSLNWREWYLQALTKSISKDEYKKRIDNIYNTYTTIDLYAEGKTRSFSI